MTALPSRVTTPVTRVVSAFACWPVARASLMTMPDRFGITYEGKEDEYHIGVTADVVLIFLAFVGDAEPVGHRHQARAGDGPAGEGRDDPRDRRGDARWQGRHRRARRRLAEAPEGDEPAQRHDSTGTHRPD